MEVRAWEISHLINLHSKKKVTPADLLKRKKAGIKRNTTTAAITKRTLDELGEELGV